MTSRSPLLPLLLLVLTLLAAWPPAASWALTLTDTGAGLPAVAYGAAAWGDYDNDGDLDVAISGYLAGDVTMCSIFRNDAGVFTDIGAGLEPNHHGDLAWGDFNNDGWLDLAVCGRAADGHAFMRIYANDSGVEFPAVGLPLPDVGDGCLAWVDANNDGALDLAFAGNTPSGQVTKVYRQEGGWFVDSGASLPGVTLGSMAWADYDNDGDFDLALQGWNPGGQVGATYRNDGAGAFTLGTGLAWADWGDLEWGDLDGDGDFDLLQVGTCSNCSGGTTGTIRVNNAGVLTYSTNLYSGAYGSVAVGDIDGDGDSDALSTGRHWDPVADTALYVHRNAGNFHFDWESVQGAGPALHGDARFVDSDNDGRLELFLMGLNSAERFARVYDVLSANTNAPPSAPGSPSATLVNGVLTMNWAGATDDRTPSPGLSYNIRIGWAAGGEEVMAAQSDPATGWRRIAQPGNAQQRTSWSVKLPRSDVAYWAVQAVDASFAGGPFVTGSVTPTNHRITATAGANGSVTPAGDAWVTRGGSQAYTITPAVGYAIGSVKVDGVHVGTMSSYTFTNVTSDHTITASFTGPTDTNAGLPAVANGAAAWGDYDNDGDLDVALSGYLAGDVAMCSIFRNDGGVFTDIGAGLEPNHHGDLAWGDFNNDGWLDLAVCGTGTDWNSFMRIYANDSGVEFPAVGLALPAVSGGCIAWVDANNDGALDLAFAGNTPSGQVTKVYRQEGGWFVDSGASLPGVMFGSMAWADYDNDGDFDLALQGWNPGGRVGATYKNDGAGAFTLGAGLTWADSGDLEWGDLEGDGDFDLLQTGACSNCSDGTTGTIYRNNAGVLGYSANLYSGTDGSVAVGDIDGDGDSDALCTGRHWDPVADTALYVHRNAGDFQFNREPVEGVGPALYGDARFVDSDNDGRLELFLMGLNSAERFARVYDVPSPNTNTPPSAPGTPSATLANGVLAMSWTPATDDRTPSPGLSYNIRVGWAAGGEEVMAAHADAATGWRRIAQPGNAQQRTSWSVKLPRSDVAYWAVQAVDASFAGGPFVTGSVTPANHRITASAGANGAISPAGGTWVTRGGSQAYTITPAAGYVIGSVKVDGVHVGTMSSYTFTNVTSDHTITASFSTFVNVTASPVDGDNAFNRGVAWNDFDGDGDLDLFLTNTAWSNRLLRNDGGGAFTNVTPASLAATQWSGGMAWGDYDNDGDSDLYLVQWNGPNRLMRNDGGGAFTDVATPALADAAARGSNAAWADYDRDGDLDLFLVNESEPNRLFRNDGAAGFVDVATPAVAGTGGGRGAAWGDYDGDGDPDLYVTFFGQPNRLLRNDGGGTFTDVATGALADAGQGQGVAWADYDSDGDLDLYFANTNGPGKLLRNDGAGGFTDVTSGPLATTLYGRGVAWGDYDNDRDPDLFLVQNGEPNRLLRNDGGGTFTDVTGSPLGDNQSALAGTWGDYDGDGRLDLYFTNSFSTNRLLRNATVNTNHWLQVRLRGTLSNRDGIGARVRVLLSGTWQTVEVSGGSGYYSQPPLVASFGLGAWTAITRLEVWWPSGLHQVVSPIPAVDQRITVVESADPLADMTVAPLTGPENPQGAAWADYDGDGDPDLYLTSDNSNNNRLLRNDAGTFTDVTAAPFTSSGSTYGAGWGDYDGDGDPDLAVGCYSSTVRLLRNDGAGAFADASAAPISSGYGSTTPTWLDYDLDGRLDLLVVRGGGGRSPLYRNLGAAGFEDVGATVLPVDGYCHGGAWGDFDDDGDLDLYVARTTLAARLYRNDRTVFTDVTAGTPLGLTGIESAAWGDYDNDGDLDLFAVSSGTNTSRLFRNEGGGAFTDVTSGPLATGTQGVSVAWLDYDHDGDLDLLRTNRLSNNLLLRNDGDGVFASAAPEPLARWGAQNLGLACADYDLDGDMDIFYVNRSNSCRLLRNDVAGANHGLQVRLRGTFSHRDAIGARVTLYAGGLRQVRELAPGAGFASQHEPVLDFGLGAATVVDSVFVHWPYGGNQRVTPTPEVDQRILVVEAGSVTAADGPGAPPAVLELAPVTPNPARGRAAIAFGLPRAGRVSLDVLDLAGRRVAALADGAWPAGRHSLDWSPGGRTPAGVYFVRLAVDDGERHETRVRKVVLAN